MNDYTGLSHEQHKKLLHDVDMVKEVCSDESSIVARNLTDFLWKLHYNKFIDIETVRYYLDLLVGALTEKLTERKRGRNVAAREV